MLLFMQIIYNLRTKVDVIRVTHAWYLIIIKYKLLTLVTGCLKPGTQVLIENGIFLCLIKEVHPAKLIKAKLGYTHNPQI